MTRLALLVAALALASCRTPSTIHPLAAENNTFGTRYLEEGQLDKAQHRFELALEYNVDYPEPYNNLCLVWIKRGNLKRAKELCIKALRFNNDFAEAHNNLGYIYMQERTLGKAADSFRNALKVNPGYLEARYNLCLTLLRLKRPEEARVCYSKVVEVNPHVADPYRDLCVMDIDDGSFPEALGNCGRAVELDPKFADAWFHLGLAFQGAGKQCEAVEAYKQCVLADDASAECHNNLSSAARRCALNAPHLRELKNEADAEGSAATLYKLGMAEKSDGLIPEAERRFKKCVKADARFGPCYCQLADLARQVADEDRARTMCEKCLRHSGPEQKGPEHETCERDLER